jgi:glutamate synthase domain-containing protein 3
MNIMDLNSVSVTDINQALHQQDISGEWKIINTKGQHNVAVGLNHAVAVDIEGHTGYYCAGMNQHATITIHGNAGQGVAENMMSGTVHVKGDASSSAGATGCGGLLIIDGNAGARCGISMKGVNIVVKGNIGHMSCFMAQAGTLVVCGDAGDALGDSLYETHIYVKGSVKSLGADCVEKEMRDEHIKELSELLQQADCTDDPTSFKRYGSARNLYNFKVDNASAY